MQVAKIMRHMLKPSFLNSKIPFGKDNGSIAQSKAPDNPDQLYES